MQPAYSHEEVLQSLQTVLQDPKFAAAPQMSAFLKFVVMQTLEGKADRIKAYTVAVDALGKPATFDPQNDPSVRVLAKRLRDTLTAYYERTSGHTVKLRLHCGSYIPEFEPVVNTHAGAESETQAEVQPLLKASNITTLTRTTEKSNLVNTGLTNDDTVFKDFYIEIATSGNESYNQPMCRR